MRAIEALIMDTCEIFDIGRSPLLNVREVNANETFPNLGANERIKRKLQRHNSYAARSNYAVPEPGYEYDFRRTPEGRHKRHPPAAQSSKRPHIPVDTHTRYAIEEYRNDAYTPARTQGRSGAETPRIPTPMPQGYPTHSAWDNGKQANKLGI